MAGVSVNTYAHTVTFVSDNLLLSLKKIIRQSGLDPTKLAKKWDSTDRALRTWLRTKDLKRIKLEIYKPGSQTLAGLWDMKVNYSYGGGDGSRWFDSEALRHAVKKASAVPSRCDYRILLTTKPGRPDVKGWGPAKARSTDGLVRQSVGTTIGTSQVGTDLGFYRSK